MKITAATLLSLACFLGAAEHLQGYRILAVIPTPSYSHQVPFRQLWLELIRRGHELVLVTTNPIPENLPNLTQIDVGSTFHLARDSDFVRLRFDGYTWLQTLEAIIMYFGLTIGEAVLGHPELMKMYAPESNVTFDVVIVEMLLTPAPYIFAHRFNAPLIGAGSMGLMGFNEYALGGLILPSHEYSWELEARTGMNLPFWKRLQNFGEQWYNIYKVYRDIFPAQQMLVEKYFGKDVPSLLDIAKNTSLVIVNQADVLTPAKPKLVNMISFTSTHVKDDPDPLSKDLKRFIDDAPEGFIYFSLGTNAKSSDMPKETLQIFTDVFAKLPYKVVWKFEKYLPGKPENVYISKWLPQQSILAQPNIKLFIYQGGMQSSEEAIHFEVPLLGVPIFADQDYQVNRMVAVGVAKRLEIVTMTRDQLECAIREMISDEGYRQRMTELKARIHDTPHESADHLTWWIEYVIRHKGAPHLRSNLAWQPWYQRFDTDIIAFLSIVAFIILSSVVTLIVKIVVRVYKRRQTVPTGQKHKLS